MPKIIIASGPVIIENGKVLLNKHGDDSFWKFPGGRVGDFDFEDWNKALEEVARQKVNEEMGIDVKFIKPLRTLLLPKPGGKDSYVVLIHFLAERIGEVKSGEDIREWDWIDVENLPDDVAENVKIILRNLKI